MGKIGEAGMERPSSNLRPLSNLCSTDPFEFAPTSADLSWKAVERGNPSPLEIDEGFFWGDDMSDHEH